MTHLVRTYTESVFPRTIAQNADRSWNQVETLEATGSVVTTLSRMGMTIVTGSRCTWDQYNDLFHVAACAICRNTTRTA